MDFLAGLKHCREPRTSGPLLLTVPSAGCATNSSVGRWCGVGGRRPLPIGWAPGPNQQPGEWHGVCVTAQQHIHTKGVRGDTRYTKNPPHHTPSKPLGKLADFPTSFLLYCAGAGLVGCVVGRVVVVAAKGPLSILPRALSAVSLCARWLSLAHTREGPGKCLPKC